MAVPDAVKVPEADTLPLDCWIKVYVPAGNAEPFTVMALRI